MHAGTIPQAGGNLVEFSVFLKSFPRQRESRKIDE